MHFAIAECIRLVRESKITFHGDVPQSALEWGLAWKVRRKVCTFHAYMLYRPFQQGSAWKVVLIKAQLEDFANHYLQGNDVPRFPDVIDQEPNWRRMWISDLM